MASTPTVYVICDQNCKFEGMTKEQILTAIMQAVNEGSIGNVDAGFITTVKTINGLPLKFFLGSQAQYNELTDEDKQGVFALITDDTTAVNMANMLAQIDTALNALVNGLNTGLIVVNKAKTAANATSAENAKAADEATKAGYLEASDGTKFSRKTLWKNTTTVIGESSTGFMSAGTTNTLNLSTNLSGKWLVAEVRKLKKNSIGLYDIEHSFRTCAFCPTNAENVTDGKENGFSQNIGGTKLTLFVNGSTLYYISSDGAYFLYKIYEEQ